MLIGIAGPSASGKSTLAAKLSDYFNSDGLTSAVISLDDYYIDYTPLPKDEQSMLNFDQPCAIDFNLFRKHLYKLVRGSAIPKIKYLHAPNKRIYLEAKIEPSEIIIIEGLYALYDKQLLEKFDLKIFMDADIWKCLQRRLERARINPDRNELSEQMIKRYIEQVVPGYINYIAPTKNLADIVLCEEKIFNNKIVKNIYTKVKSWEKK